MIQKDCFTSAWIDIVSKQLKYNDKNLIEKVIRALSLLEMLVEAKCPGRRHCVSQHAVRLVTVILRNCSKA